MCNTKKLKKLVSRMLAVSLLTGILMNVYGGVTLDVYAQEKKSGVVAGSNLVRVRADAGTSYEVVTQLVRYQEIDILGEKEAANGVKWYRIGFDLNGTYTEGYMHSTYVMETTKLPEPEARDEAFETEIAAFPESYKSYLRSLHKLFPNWHFEDVDTGLEWENAVDEEYVVRRNLVPEDSGFSWKSLRADDFNWTSGEWIGHDSIWVGASREAIAYYLDPRNFLTADSRILQFESLKYEEGVQTKEGVEAILSGSFMAGGQYADWFLKAGKEADVSPYLLASRVLQEVGKNGSSTTSGNYAGYEGYYNFFNFGATANEDGTGAVENALKYAKEKGWDTPEKALCGGAKLIGANYVAKGQNTFYFQKFNVVNTESGLFLHQYMQNLSAASTEGASLRKIHTDWENSSITFRIPVYRNMPEEASALPVQVTNNYNYLDDLQVNEQTVEGFSPEIQNYEINVTGGAIFAFAGTTPMPGAVATVPESVYLTPGNHQKEVTVQAVDGSLRTYTLSLNIGEGKKGDADNDGALTANDALIILKIVAKMQNVEGDNLIQLDTETNGQVDANDALLILKVVAKMIDF